MTKIGSHVNIWISDWRNVICDIKIWLSNCYLCIYQIVTGITLSYNFSPFELIWMDYIKTLVIIFSTINIFTYGFIKSSLWHENISDTLKFIFWCQKHQIKLYFSKILVSAKIDVELSNSPSVCVLIVWIGLFWFETQISNKKQKWAKRVTFVTS